MRRMLYLLLPLAALSACMGSGGGRPSLFVGGTFEEAVVLSQTTGKVLVVDAMAEWCAPCKRMDQTTWVNPKVTGWFAQNGIAFQFDVDESPGLAQQFQIDAMPTILVLRDGREVMRHTGYLSADSLLGLLRAFES